MRHYCNRQTPKQYNPNENPQKKRNIPPQPPIISTQATPINNLAPTQDTADEDLVLPPSSDYNIGLNVPNNNYGSSTQYAELNAQGGSVSQGSGYTKQLTEDIKNNFCSTGNCPVYDVDYGIMNNSHQMFNDTSGSMGVISLPHMYEQLQTTSMTSYLNQYKGKYICIDLWTSDARRLEKCGTLVDIGDDFLVIRKGCTGEMTMIDLGTIRYISIYCR